MKKAILTSGPRGAGKTSFCREIIKQRPEVVLIERDAIFVELFGTVYTNRYTGECHWGMQKVWERVKESFWRDRCNTLVLDAWNGYPNERRAMVLKLREAGADYVELWYFVTAEELCLKQFISREGNSTIPPERKEELSRRCRWDFQLFHSMEIANPVMPDNNQDDDRGDLWPDCFDEIKLINPAQLTLIPYADLLGV